jgi:hypothetical protein
MKNEKCDVQKGSEERHSVETISSPPNSGNVISAQPVVDAGHDSGAGHWEGSGQDVRWIENKKDGLSKDVPKRETDHTRNFPAGVDAPNHKKK